MFCVLKEHKYFVFTSERQLLMSKLMQWLVAVESQVRGFVHAWIIFSNLLVHVLNNNWQRNGEVLARMKLDKKMMAQPDPTNIDLLKLIIVQARKYVKNIVLQMKCHVVVRNVSGLLLDHTVSYPRKCYSSQPLSASNPTKKFITHCKYGLLSTLSPYSDYNSIMSSIDC